MTKTTLSFLIATLDHAANDAKTPYHLIKSRYEEWKQMRMNQMSEDQEAEEEYIIKYSSKRTEREHAYQQWHDLRSEKMKKSKDTNKIGEQEKIIKELSSIPFPEEFSIYIPDIYTKYKPNQY